MSFRFRVRRATSLRGICLIDGTVETGAVRGGTEATVVLPAGERRVSIKSVALVNSPTGEYSLTTLSIEPPDYPLSELEGAVLVGHEP